MEHRLNEVNTLAALKATFTVSRPQSIREKLADWAFADADDAEGVIASLERLDCAACYSPVPIYHHDMAREIGEHLPEIDAALDSYRDNTGQAWTPKEGQNFLTYLWFAYEWTAYELANDIRNELETSEERN
jgi:hypothetical protein